MHGSCVIQIAEVEVGGFMPLSSSALTVNVATNLVAAITRFSEVRPQLSIASKPLSDEF